MKRITWIILLLVPLGLLAFRLPGPDLKAERLLRETREFMLGLTDFSARFRYAMHKPGARHQVLPQKGLLKYQKGRYAVLMNDQEIYFDQAVLWTWFKTDGEATVQSMDPAEGWNLEQLFKLSEIGEKPQYMGRDTLEGIPCHKINLSVDKPDLEYHQATVWIGADIRIFHQAKLTDRRGIETTYTFFNHKLNPGFGPEAFRFDAEGHPDVRIIDERTGK